jgi:hypothetical protein
MSTSSSASTVVDYRRETLTMGLYVSITLLAALAVTGDGDGSEDVLAIVWGTTIGLALAHWFAFDLVVRLVVAHPQPSHVTRELLFELMGVFAVAVLATITLALVPQHLERQAVRAVMALAIGTVTFIEARVYGSSWRRAAAAGAIALVLASVVAGVKHQLTH